MFLVSCKKEVDQYVDVTGQVINEQTGTPIEGISISLESQLGGSIGSGYQSTADKTITDVNGRYAFYKKVEENTNWSIYINSKPYDSYYSTDWFTVQGRMKYNKINRLYINTALSVTSNTTNSLGVNDDLYIEIPGIGCHCGSIETERAKGNSYNIVKWTVTRNNVSTTYSDSLFCNVDTQNGYIINY